jgi:hypothetical protein
MIGLAALVLLALCGQETISSAEYRDRLGSIRSAIESGDLASARRKASELQPVRVRHEGMEFSADRAVLRPIADAKDLGSAREAARALKPLAEALESIPAGPAASADRALLEKLRQEEAERGLDPGAKVGGPGLHAPPVPRSLLEWLQDLARQIWDFVKQLLEKFFRWLLRMLLGNSGAGIKGSGMTWMVMGVTLAILGIVGAIAFVTLRRRPAPAEAASGPAPAVTGRDEDPLSRSSNEWERFAAELMKSGRFREAVRAWYHAVLVTLFRSGTLHYRKDRTNWEYAYALSPDVAWRPGFVEATRTFEQIWYGRSETPAETAEAYAADALGILGKVRGGRAP